MARPAQAGPSTTALDGGADDMSGQENEAPFDAANPKGRHRPRSRTTAAAKGANDGAAERGRGKGKGKGKAKVEEYEVDSERLAKYLKGAANVAKRDKYDWRKRTHNDKKLSRGLADLGAANVKVAAEAAERDDLLLPEETSGALLVAESELEKTYKVTQEDIKAASGSAAAARSFGLSLDGGPFSFDYTRNGRYLALAGRKNGHLATVDWAASKPMTEVHVNETTRAIRWLHDESFFATAQRRYVYIYDGRQGAEVHQLRGHIEVTRMEFLPYHFLLATVGLPGWLKYHDTSTGQLVAELRTRLGGCDVMAQDPYNSIIHLGHGNGTVTLWSPGLSQPHVKLLAHRGPVTGLGIDPTSSGRLLTTAGLDGAVKVWDMRNDWKPLAAWQLRKPAHSVAWSQKGLLALGWGPHVSVYAGVGRQGTEKGAYMTQLFPGQDVRQVQFCPYEDVLGVGHTAGFSSLIVPGAGEAHIDSLEADPYESASRRREREVHRLLDKLPADLIALDPDIVGTIRAPPPKENPEKAAIRRAAAGGGPKGETPFRKLPRLERLEKQGKKGIENDDDEEYEGKVAGEDDDGPGKRAKKEAKEKKKMRGKNSSLKRLIRKKRKNVITPEIEAIKAKIAHRREQHQARKEGRVETKGALARFA